jgi:hypothetical protein
MRKKLGEPLLPGIGEATGVPEDGAGWCERCQKKLVGYESGSGKVGESCSGCGFGVIVAASGGAPILQMPPHCRGFEQSEVVCKLPVVVRLKCLECLRTRTIRLSDRVGALCTWES